MVRSAQRGPVRCGGQGEAHRGRTAGDIQLVRHCGGAASEAGLDCVPLCGPAYRMVSGRFPYTIVGNETCRLKVNGKGPGGKHARGLQRTWWND